MKKLTVVIKRESDMVADFRWGVPNGNEHTLTMRIFGRMPNITTVSMVFLSNEIEEMASGFSEDLRCDELILRRGEEEMIIHRSLVFKFVEAVKRKGGDVALERIMNEERCVVFVNED